jgi:hypothetical protein
VLVRKNTATALDTVLKEYEKSPKTNGEIIWLVCLHYTIQQPQQQQQWFDCSCIISLLSSLAVESRQFDD